MSEKSVMCFEDSRNLYFDAMILTSKIRWDAVGFALSANGDSSMELKREHNTTLLYTI